jgi:succinate dehydrogenase/fumarate reductase cytochrome b subunit
MTNVNWERYGRATGIVFVVLFIVSYLIYGSPPKIGASTSDITSFYDGDRGKILTAMVIFGVAIVFLFWFVAAIASALRDVGKGGWGSATIAAGTALGTVFLVLVALNAGLAYSIAGYGDEGVITALSDMSWIIGVTVSYPAALLIGAASIGLLGTRLVPSWYGPVGILAAILILLGGTTWATSGFWAADGAYSQWISPIIAMAWIAVTSGLLYMRAPSTAVAPERAAVPMH